MKYVIQSDIIKMKIVAVLKNSLVIGTSSKMH